jgi:hypothetical protein
MKNPGCSDRTKQSGVRTYSSERRTRFQVRGTFLSQNSEGIKTNHPKRNYQVLHLYPQRPLAQPG